MSRYSLDRHDRKIAGVCSTLGDVFNIDPTFIRIGFVAALFLVGWEVALVAYVAAGIYLHVRKRRALGGDGRAPRGEQRKSDFERMAESGKRRASVHDLRTRLDANDRRMMAVDHHLSSHNDELAREIEALRGDEK